MKIVVVGGTGLIGSAVVETLRAEGHDAVAAAPSTGVDTLTGNGLAEALGGAQVLVDVSNSPSFADDDVLDFFTRSTTNMLAAGRAAGIGHYVALSIVGADRAPDSGYLRAKVAQEKLITGSGLPFTILRVTQFFEFLDAIADGGADGTTVTVPPAPFQPIAAADVSAAVAQAATAAPAGGVENLAGPQRRPMDVFVREALAARADPRTVVADSAARYFGADVSGGELVPADGARTASTGFADWLAARAVTR